MARLNTTLLATPQPTRSTTVDSLYRDPSATPRPTRSTTVDSLYRDPSVAPRHESNARTEPYSVMSLSSSMRSDKENELPASRENTPQPQKRWGARATSARMPTPDSGSTSVSTGSKRRRTGDYNMSSGIYGDQPENDRKIEDSVEAAPAQPDEDEPKNLRFYNPNQDPKKQRQLRANMRDHHRMVEENRVEFSKNNNLLLDALKKQDSLFTKVRQTADAALDSRFLVNASELAGKKLNNSLQGNVGVGIDLDQFVSKCIYFMRSKGLGSGEDAPVAPVGEEDDDEAGDDGLDWALLGRQACFPSNKRPPTTSFLLGPLSVQKKVRNTQRKARSQKEPVGPATRPQEIKRGDIQKSDNSNLSTLVKGINARLREHIEDVDDKVAAELSELEEETPQMEDLAAASRRYRGAVAPTEELAVNLLDFAINPHDFGQTVENLFYISFLVREGAAKIIKDEEGLPLLMPAKARDIAEHRENNVQKNQAVLSIDYDDWKMFIEAFDIKEPLIPHREQEEPNIAPEGWYAG